MVAGAVSSVGRAVNAAADAAREAASAANARVNDFVDGLSKRAANNNQAPQPPANDDSISGQGGVPPGQGAPSGAPPATPSDPTASPTGAVRETGRAAGTLVNPADEIGKLNSDGDQVVMQMTGEGKLQVPVPIGNVPIGVGAKGQYGYGITVTQVGDTPQPGTNGAQPTYNVTFDKNLQGGGTIEPPVPGIDPAAELNLGTSDSVTMSFNSQADAARAVGILQRLAAAQTVRDAGHLATPSLSNPAENPVIDDRSGLPSLPTPADPIADRIAPPQSDMTFLRDHIRSFSTTVSLQERGKVAAKFANLGIEPRLDANQRLTRTVELPHDGQPGRLTYTLSGDLQASTKEKLTLGKQEFDQLEIGFVPQNIVDHGRFRGEVSMSWDLPPGATDTTVSGHPAPELSALRDGAPLGAPDEVSARLQLDYHTQSPTDLSRTDMQRLSIEATTRNPGIHAGPVISNLLQGDLQNAFRSMGDDFTVTAQSEAVERNGVQQQHEVGVEFADVVEAKLSVIANIGRDDITGRRTATFTGTELADRLGGAQQPSPGQPPEQPTTRPDQLVVVPNEGLNVRNAPSADAPVNSAFLHGTFVQPTGQRRTDAQGREWLEVQGPDVNDRPVQGWVAADHVRSHPAGTMDETGRINPDLERQGYREHVVQPGDTVWDLARRDGVNFRDMMQLNGDHLINPGMIFPGDKVYIPGTGQQQPTVPPQPVPQQPQPPQSPPSAPGAPSAPSAPSDPSAPSGGPSGPSAPSDPQGGAPSGGAPSDGGPSGAPSGGAPTPTPQQPQAPQPGTQGRPDLNRVLHDYQIPDDPGGTVQWEPHGGIAGRIVGLFTDPQTVTATEARMLDQMSIGDLRAMRDFRNQAPDVANNQFPPPQDKRANFPPGQQGDRNFSSWAANDGHNDAFRHAYWNALMTQRFGADFTERFTNAHEGVAGNRADREAMDLYNNGVGRRIAQANPNASPEELAGLVRQAITNGEMVVIDRSGNLAWSDQVPVGEHGVANDGPVPGVMAPPPANGPGSSGPGTS